MPIRALIAAVASGLVLASASGAATHPRLIGTTGPGFKIQLTFNGVRAVKLRPGTYTLIVHDRASIHDFHLIGPGINKTVTTVPFVGTKTVTVTLRKGKYTYQCDPHAARGMKGTFAVS